MILASVLLFLQVNGSVTSTYLEDGDNIYVYRCVEGPYIINGKRKLVSETVNGRQVIKVYLVRCKTA